MRVMASLRARYIPIREIILVLAACIFPIYVWSIIQRLREVPAWILRTTAWELVGVIAYTQAFALLESLVVLTILIFLGMILPARFFRDKFVPLSSMIVFLTAMWAVFAHFNDGYIRLWTIKQFIPWFGVYVLSIGLGYLVVQRDERLAGSIRALVEKIMVLSYIYVIVGIISVFVIIIRNI